MADDSCAKASWTQEQQAYYKKHKAAAARILACDRHDYLQILGLKEPVTEVKVHEAFAPLSNLLSPECQIAEQDESAQEAHDRKCHLQAFEELLTNMVTQDCGKQPKNWEQTCPNIMEIMIAPQYSARTPKPSIPKMCLQLETMVSIHPDNMTLNKDRVVMSMSGKNTPIRS